MYSLFPSATKNSPVEISKKETPIDLVTKYTSKSYWLCGLKPYHCETLVYNNYLCNTL